jgi:ABC-2 type transport system ATP-binding protein
MRMLVVDVAAGGRTVLLSSHLLAEVQQICERVGVVAGGRLLHEGTVDQMRGGSVLEVRAAPVAVAAAVVARVTGAAPDRGVDEYGHEVVTVPAAGIDVPDLARHLVRDGVDLHTLVVRERALEEVFLSMTGVS